MAGDNGYLKLYNIADLTNIIVSKDTGFTISWVEYIAKDNLAVAGISEDKDRIFVKLN